MKKLEKIRKIVNKAVRGFEEAKFVEIKHKGKIIGKGVKETKAYGRKRLEKNFHVYAKALEEIYDIVK